MAVSVVRLGSKRARGEGPRLGTVRRPPRGVRKSEYATRNYYDVWLPLLAPSAALVKRALSAKNEREFDAFARAYRREMSRPDAARTLDLLATLSQAASFAVGCYCEDEARCHRSVLRELLRERGAVLR
ncbi:MAG: DUF488 family protein [Myxococcales bacterium]|nr:MAG: DUF488 family protein [Myxococcales bacterium]